MISKSRDSAAWVSQSKYTLHTSKASRSFQREIISGLSTAQESLT